MFLSNCHVKFVFPLALAVEGSALGLIFFSFSFWLLFQDARKFKNWWEHRENIQDLFPRISGPVNGPKSSTLNCVSNLNFQNNFFPLFKDLSFLLVSSVTGKNQI